MKNAARFALFSVVALFAACASSNSAAKPPITEPKLLVVQLSDVALAAVHTTGPVSVKYQLQIHNVAAEPITLRHLQLESIGYGAYTLRPTSQNFEGTTIAPDQTVAVDFWMAAQIAMDSVSGANGPVTLRGQAQFDSPKGMFQTTWTQQVHEYGDVSGGH